MPARGKVASSVANVVKPSMKSNGTPKRGVKRKAVASTDSSGSDFESASTPKKARPARNASANSRKKPALPNAGVEITEQPPPAPKVDWNLERPIYLPAELNFSYEEAKGHLINADPRFGSIFERLACRPFVQLERLEPFR
jgi:DNA-3-methyladenine glycosylase II